MMKKTFLIAGFAALVIGSQAKAADLPFPPPMPEPVLPPIESSGGGWYLRGDVGVGLENMKGFNFDITNPQGAGGLTGFSLIQKSMNDKAIIGTGLGYQWNDYLRFDVTGEYRSANSFGFTLAGPTPSPNQQLSACLTLIMTLAISGALCLSSAPALVLPITRSQASTILAKALRLADLALPNPKRPLLSPGLFMPASIMRSTRI
jgi:hypothetical protein